MIFRVKQAFKAGFAFFIYEKHKKFLLYLFESPHRYLNGIDCRGIAFSSGKYMFKKFNVLLSVEYRKIAA